MVSKELKAPTKSYGVNLEYPTLKGTIFLTYKAIEKDEKNLKAFLRDAQKFTLEHTAELIKDLRQDHEPPGGGDKLAWFPTAITLPNKGMVFPEWNKRLQDWYWAAVNAVPVTEEEKEKYPDPANPGEFYKFRMDMKNIKRFNKLEFMDAAEEIGIFDEE